MLRLEWQIYRVESRERERLVCLGSGLCAVKKVSYVTVVS